MECPYILSNFKDASIILFSSHSKVGTMYHADPTTRQMKELRAEDVIVVNDASVMCNCYRVQLNLSLVANKRKLHRVRKSQYC